MGTTFVLVKADTAFIVGDVSTVINHYAGSSKGNLSLRTNMTET